MTSPPQGDAAHCPFDAAYLADPHRVYRALRQAAAVHHVVTPDGAPVWLVTRYDDVRAALSDPRLSLDKRNARTGGDYGDSLPPQLSAHLLNMDPPDHTRLRRLAGQAFTARRVERLRRDVQRLVDELLDDIAAHDTVDLVASFAAPLPLAVIYTLLGIPSGPATDYRRWTNTLLSPDPDQPAQSREAMLHMHAALVDLIAAKRARPSDDLLSALIMASDSEDRLTEGELVSLTFLILFAGYDSSVGLITTTVWALLTHPQLLADVRRGATAVSDVVEEVLRWEGPAPLSVRRFAIEDVTIGGVTIPTGDRVWLSLASASRDPDRFVDPDQLRVPRPDNPHVAFGHGIHYCMGAPLARLQAQVAVQRLLDRFLAIKLAVPQEGLRWQRSYRARALEELPVRLG